MTIDQATLNQDDLDLPALLGEGRTQHQTSRCLGVSVRTLRRRLDKVCTQLEVTSPVQALVWAARHGLI